LGIGERATMKRVLWSTISGIKKELLKKWQRGFYFRLLLDNNNEEKIRIPLKKPQSREISEFFDEVRLWISEFSTNSSNHLFEIEWKTINHRTLGENKIPSAILFFSIEKLSEFVGKLAEYKKFITNQIMLVQVYPQLESWIYKYPMKILLPSGTLKNLLNVTGWIKQNPLSGIYLRQITLPGIDTKFIEQNKKILSEWLDRVLPPESINESFTGTGGFENRYGFKSKPELVRFRFLDKDNFINNVSDMTIRTDEFCALDLDIDTVFVTENDINGLSFPPVKRAIVIFGRGYGFSYLKDAWWLQNKLVWYWGDIDTHGFAILSQFRSFVPHTKSFLMNRGTLLAHKSSWVQEQKQVKHAVPNLIDDEKRLFEDLQKNRYGESVRLEQELVRWEVVVGEAGGKAG